LVPYRSVRRTDKWRHNDSLYHANIASYGKKTIVADYTNSVHVTLKLFYGKQHKHFATLTRKALESMTELMMVALDE